MGIFDGKKRELLEETEKKVTDLIIQLDNAKMATADLEARIENGDVEKGKIELEKRALELENDNYKSLLADDAGNIRNAKERLQTLKYQISKAEIELSVSYEKLNNVNKAVEDLEKEYIVMDEAVLLQNFGLYTPKYCFTNSSIYYNHLLEIRDKQAQMVKNDKAAICSGTWSVEGNIAKGKKLIEDNIKQILRTFNTECDNIVQTVKFSNYETSRKRMLKSLEVLNKLNRTNKIAIQSEYLELKYQELDLAYEYAQKKQTEKDDLRQQRELKREELRLAREIEEKRMEAEKEQQHYLNAMEKLHEQIECEKNQERLLLLKEREIELLNGLEDVDAVLKDLDYREANCRAGYVYVISNIGAFGENIYKIGMTRRLDPKERVDELGSASVPFKFDVHAMIFSDNAPKLEASLHQAFDKNKLNVVNGRKEFFNVTLEEIKKVVIANHDKSVDFVEYPEAQQYRESLIMKSLYN